MAAYGEAVESAVRRLFDSPSEPFDVAQGEDRRRHAVVESLKLDHGGLEYVAAVMGCDPKTVRQRQAELAELPADPAGGRVRKKGVAADRGAGPGHLSHAAMRASASGLAW